MIRTFINDALYSNRFNQFTLPCKLCTIVLLLLVLISSVSVASGSDTTPPELVSTDPAIGYQHIPTSHRTISFTFNEAMHFHHSVTFWGLSADYTDFASLEWSSDQKTISITFDRDLPLDKTISWVLNPSTHSNGFCDLDGNLLPNDTYSGSFKTLGSVLDDTDGDGLSRNDELKYGTDPDNADSDGDGLNDNEELELSYKFLPTLRFDTGESQYPISIEDFLAESNLEGYDPNAEKWEPIRSPPVEFTDSLLTLLSILNNSGKYNQYKLDLIHDSAYYAHNYYPTVYVSVAPTVFGQEKLIAIQYWYLYYYNPLLKYEYGFAHEGDWEHITIFVDYDLKFPKYTRYSQHDRLEPKDWNSDISKDDLTHPQIFVMRSSHASHNNTNCWMIEPCDGNGINTPWIGFNDYFKLITNQGWSNYLDYWGGTIERSAADSPKSPWGRFNFIIPSQELISITATVYSPVYLHAVDQYGRHVGVNETTDEFDMQIPESSYSGPDAHPQWIAIYNESLEITFYTTGIDSGTFDIDIEILEGLEGTIFEFNDIPTTTSTIAYVNSLTPYRLEIDEDGDGNIERFFYGADTSAQATIDIDPDTLNLDSKGLYISAYIELPGYDVNDINVSTINLVTPSDNATWVDLSAPATVGDYDNDGNFDLMVKFNREILVNYLSTINNDVELTITGELTSGTPFEGSDTIKVIMRSKK